ncbi:helix-turn-helix transcriptional regulator [Enemella evansiae]|uniref:helix-turn-helix transcriptional regulator n=1 Tax=Enemella evansiae TaxID=2016499 RepID=UPI000C01CA79|nr:helix-turn-helix domain-containing protein [Enemella evansiae]PFG67809.1 putative ArsR family transcriptional regulator [Propionibacteriaceae bacterium ES.041]TDO93662.1 ArsR family transcriptional regulator [Enemella evansiae]
MKNVRDDRGTPGVALAETAEDQAAGAEGPVDDASTRQRVQQSIMQHGPSTAVELAERLELTPAAIRRHLQVLLDRGHLVSREQRVYGARGRGRPAKVFALTDTGRQSFHQAYDDLAVAALAQLVEAAGDGALEELARARVATVEQRYRELRATEPDGNPVEALARALSADGYVASTRPALAGEQLCQHHCPVAHVAEQFPQLCEAETQLFGQLLGVPVQRLATIAHGDGVCTTHISTRTRDGSAAARPQNRSTSNQED